MRNARALALTLTFCILVSSGCARAPLTKDMDPEKVLEAACEPGRDIRRVEGSVWLKAQSKDASGQFPAEVLAEAPNKLKLEVTNLIGGTEAFITVDGTKYQIRVPGKKGQDRVEKGSGSWGGIPLRWSTELFLGRIPCPQADALEGAKIMIDPEGALVVDTRAKERFSYRFKMWEGRLWAESLKWESQGVESSQVDFKFEDPETKTRSPKKWEATSAMGEVKVRWQDRESKI